MSAEKHYAHYLGVSQYFALNLACRTVWDSFREAGHVGMYLVGSVLKRRDWRDVDVRMMMEDPAFDRMFGPQPERFSGIDLSPLMLLNAAVSEWLQHRCGLPVDFQFQRMSKANEEFSSKEGHTRNAIGIAHMRSDYAEDVSSGI